MRMGDAAFVDRFADAARPVRTSPSSGEVTWRPGIPFSCSIAPRHQVTIGDVERAYHGDSDLLGVLVDLEDLSEGWRDWARRHS